MEQCAQLSSKYWTPRHNISFITPEEMSQKNKNITPFLNCSQSPDIPLNLFTSSVFFLKLIGFLQERRVLGAFGMGLVQCSGPAEWSKPALLNRDFGNILHVFSWKGSKTKRSLKFLESGHPNIHSTCHLSRDYYRSHSFLVSVMRRLCYGARHFFPKKYFCDR